MRDLELTSSVLLGQSPLYLHGGRTLWAEKVKLSWAHREALPHTGAEYGGLPGLFQPSGWHLSHLSPEAAWGRLQEVKQTGVDPASGWCGAELFLAVKHLNSSPLGGRAGQRCVSPAGGCYLPKAKQHHLMAS